MTTSQISIKEIQHKHSKISPTPKSPYKRLWSKKSLVLILCIICLIALCIPLKKKSGAEFEIEGTPATNIAFLRASVDGIVKTINVETGQWINQNQTIAVLQNWDLEEKIINTQRELVELQSAIHQSSNNSNVANAEYQRSLTTYDRYKAKHNYINANTNKLQQQNLPEKFKSIQKEMEKKKLEIDSLIQKAALYTYLSNKGAYPLELAKEAQNKATALSKEYEALNAKLEAEKEKLQEEFISTKYESQEALISAQANQAKLQETQTSYSDLNRQAQELKHLLNFYKKQKAALVLTSPIDGFVLTLKTDLLEGQSFSKGEVIATIGDLRTVQIKVQLPEEEIAYINLSDRVTVRARGIPNQVFEGHINEIAPVTSEIDIHTFKKKIFEVTIILDNSDMLFKPGMTGYAVVHTQAKQSILQNAWGEVYKIFKLERYMDQNPFAFLSN